MMEEIKDKEQIVTNVKNSLNQELKQTQNLNNMEKQTFNFKYSIIDENNDYKPVMTFSDTLTELEIKKIVDENYQSSKKNPNDLLHKFYMNDKTIFNFEIDDKQYQSYGIERFKSNINSHFNTLKEIDLKIDKIQKIFENNHNGIELFKQYRWAEIEERSNYHNSDYNTEEQNKYRNLLNSASTIEKQQYYNIINELENIEIYIESNILSTFLEQSNNFKYENGKIKDVPDPTKERLDLSEKTEHLNNQMKYLGLGDHHREAIQKGIDSKDKSFQIHTTSDRVMEGNKVDFTANFNKSEKGGVFLNSYDTRLITQDGEERMHNFRLNFTAKEAINLLEGRAVKTEFINSKTNEPFESFVKLKFNEPKNEYGNYKMEFHKANEIDTAKIVELSGLKFEKEEYRDNVIKSLEKGNITNVKFTHEGNEIEGKAVLNPQYKNLNLYDKSMNRLNTNKPLQGLEQDNSHEKNNVRQQNISRSL